MDKTFNQLSFSKTSINDYDIYTMNNPEWLNFGIIHAGHNSVLFYPNVFIKTFIPQIKDALKHDESLKYVFISPSYVLTEELLAYFTNDFPNLIFLSDRHTALSYQLLYPQFSFQTMEIDSIINLQNNHHLKVIPAFFMPHFNSFIVYDLKARVLISHLLFSNLNQFESDTKKSILSFHEQRIPSSDFLKPLITKIKKLKPQLIIPCFGPVLEKEDLDQSLNLLSNFTFYNSTYIVKEVKENRRFYNYINLCNQILTQLKNLYGDSEVLSVFKDSDIEINPKTIEIANAPSNNFQLWHHFFNLIFDKKGPSWLAVLEKTVNKLNHLYNIKKPTVYQSSLVSSQFETIELQTQFSSLQESYNEVTEQLSRCPITKAFNETFFKNLLRKTTDDFNQKGLDEEWSLLFVDIDNIRKLNLIHSKETGDETLRNLYYILNQVKDESQEVFKRNGPGFIILCPHYDYAKSLKLAEKIRNVGETSDTFIEKITVSVAIVRLHEFSQGERKTDEIAELWFNRGESRIKLAPSLGFNQIIDERTKNIVLSIGKILIIDSDEIIHNVFKMAFQSINYEVMIAKNGLAGLDIIQVQKIDMIICEKNVAKLDGFQIKARLNQSLETQTIPFILTTYNKNKEIVISANELGIDVILTKPLIMEEVVGLVKRLTAKRVRL